MHWAFILALVLAGLVVFVGAIAALLGRTRRQASRAARAAAVEELARRAAEQAEQAPVAEARDLASLAERVGGLGQDAHGLQRRIKELEERLVALEGELRRAGDEAPAAAERLEQIEGLAETLSTRLEALASATSSEPSVRDRVRVWLEDEGFRDVVLLEDPQRDDTFAVEARRGNLSVKGSAALDGAGQVEARLAPASRIFP